MWLAHRHRCGLLTFILLSLMTLCEAYATRNTGVLYALSASNDTTIFEHGLHPPGGDLNVFQLLTDSNCGQSGFLTLHPTQNELLEPARAMSLRTRRPAFIYEVRSTEHMYPVSRSILANADRLSPALSPTARVLARIEDRWLTAENLASQDIAGVYEVHGDAPRTGASLASYRRNNNYIRRRPFITTSVYWMPVLPTVISNNYVRLARLEHGPRLLRACTVQSFNCSARPERLYAEAVHSDCLTEHNIIKMPLRQVLAQKIYSILFVPMVDTTAGAGQM